MGKSSQRVLPAGYDASTHVLTLEGFRPFTSISNEDQIATRNPAGEVEYHRPDLIIHGSYDGEMVRFRARSYDLLIAPWQPVMVARTRQVPILRATPARDIRGQSNYLLRSATWTAPDVEHYEIPGYAYRETAGTFPRRNRSGTAINHIRFSRRKLARTVLMDDWLTLLGWYISEGCAIANDRPRLGRNCFIDIRQFAVGTLDEIAAVVTRLGFHPRRPTGRVQICSAALYEHLKPLGKAGEKFIPAYARSVSARQLRLLFLALVSGDGSFRGGEPCNYYTKSPVLRDHVAEIALKLGYGTTMRFRPACGQQGPIWSLNFSRQFNVNAIKGPNRAREPYSGPVSGLVVRNHTIYVRRNGRSVWAADSTA